MPDHHRLTRYIVYANGTTFMGMLKQNNTHPELFGPDFDWTHGPYVLASEADAEIDRQRAEIEQLTRERDLWQSRAMAMFYGGDPDKATLGDIRKAADAYRAWLLIRGGSSDETTSEWLTDKQCDDVIAFLEDYEWTGLTRENVRTWCTAIAEARSSVKTSACPYGQSDCESTRGGVCRCAMPAEQAFDGRD